MCCPHDEVESTHLHEKRYRYNPFIGVFHLYVFKTKPAVSHSKQLFIFQFIFRFAFDCFYRFLMTCQMETRTLTMTIEFHMPAQTTKVSLKAALQNLSTKFTEIACHINICHRWKELTLDSLPHLTRLLQLQEMKKTFRAQVTEFRPSQLCPRHGSIVRSFTKQATRDDREKSTHNSIWTLAQLSRRLPAVRQSVWVCFNLRQPWNPCRHVLKRLRVLRHALPRTTISHQVKLQAVRTHRCKARTTRRRFMHPGAR